MANTLDGGAIGAIYDFPNEAKIVAAHSGTSSAREWNSDHSIWLHPGQSIVKDQRGEHWVVSCRRLG